MTGGELKLAAGTEYTITPEILNSDTDGTYHLHSGCCAAVHSDAYGIFAGGGLPDDEWYELRGSETGRPETRQDYAVTYYRPSAPRMNVQWTDNYGGSGLIDYLGAFHRQDYYYPAWITDDS